MKTYKTTTSDEGVFHVFMEMNDDAANEQDIKNHWGAGRYPNSRGKGRIECTAKITLEMSEVLAIQDRSINRRLQDIAPFDIQVSYIPDGGRITHDVIKDCQFMENARKWKEGDTTQTIDLPLVVSKINWGNWKK